MNNKEKLNEFEELLDKSHQFMRYDLERFKEEYKENVMPLVEFMRDNHLLLRLEDKQQETWTGLFKLSQTNELDMLEALRRIENEVYYQLN